MLCQLCHVAVDICVPRSDLLILDFEQRKLHLKKLGQKLDDMRSKHHLLLLEQVEALAAGVNNTPVRA